MIKHDADLKKNWEAKRRLNQHIDISYLVSNQSKIQIALKAHRIFRTMNSD